jgi:single-strand DNA-binding protein
VGGLPELRGLHDVRQPRREPGPHPAQGHEGGDRGQLRYSNWEKDGQRRSKIEVIVDEIEFMSQNQQAPQGYQQQYAPQPAPQQAPMPPQPVQESLYDDDIPF